MMAETEREPTKKMTRGGGGQFKSHEVECSSDRQPRPLRTARSIYPWSSSEGGRVTSVSSNWDFGTLAPQGRASEVGGRVLHFVDETYEGWGAAQNDEILKCVGAVEASRAYRSQLSETSL